MPILKYASLTKLAVLTAAQVRDCVSQIEFDSGPKPLFKTAAIGKLAEIDESKYYYLRGRFVSASDWPPNNPDNPWEPGADGWGPNGNGDAFEMEQLRKYGYTWDDAACYYNHNNTDPKNAYGYVFAWRLDEATGYIEGIIAIERGLRFDGRQTQDGRSFPDSDALIQAIDQGRVRELSMGASVEESICSICGNVAHDTFEYCDHISQKCQTIGGKLVFEFNRGCNWFEITIIPEDGSGAGQQEKIAPQTISLEASMNFRDHVKFVQGGKVMKRSTLKKVAQEIAKSKTLSTAIDKGDYGSAADIFAKDQARAKKTSEKTPSMEKTLSTAKDAGDYKLAMQMISAVAKKTRKTIQQVARMLLADDGAEGFTAPDSVRDKMTEIQDEKTEALDKMEDDREQVEQADLDAAGEAAQDLESDVRELIDALGLTAPEEDETVLDETEPDEAEGDIDLEGTDGAGEATQMAPAGEATAASKPAKVASIKSVVRQVLYSLAPGLKAKAELEQKQRNLQDLQALLPQMFRQKVAAKVQYDQLLASDAKEAAAKKVDNLTAKIAQMQSQIQVLAAGLGKSVMEQTRKDAGDYTTSSAANKAVADQAKGSSEKAKLDPKGTAGADAGDYPLTSGSDKIAKSIKAGDEVEVDEIDLKPGDAVEIVESLEELQDTVNDLAEDAGLEPEVGDEVDIDEDEGVVVDEAACSAMANLIELRNKVRTGSLPTKSKIATLAALNAKIRVIAEGAETAQDASRTDKGDYGKASGVDKATAQQAKGTSEKAKVSDKNPQGESEADKGDYPQTGSEKLGSVKVAFSEANRARWEKYWESVGGKEHTCAEKAKSFSSDPDAFCASLKDFVTGTTEWRKGPKKKSAKTIKAGDEVEFDEKDLEEIPDEPDTKTDTKTESINEGDLVEVPADAIEDVQEQVEDIIDEVTELLPEDDATGLADQTEVDGEMDLMAENPKGLEAYSALVQQRNQDIQAQADLIFKSAGKAGPGTGPQELLSASLEVAQKGNESLTEQHKAKDLPAFRGAGLATNREKELAQSLKQAQAALAREKQNQRIGHIIEEAISKGIVTEENLQAYEKALGSYSDSQLEAVEAAVIQSNRARPKGRQVHKASANGPFGQPYGAGGVDADFTFFRQGTDY